MPDVKVKGYSGTFFEYKDVDKVWLQTADSTEDDPVLVPYSYGEVVEGLEITPDFSAGDMSVSVPDGSLVKEAVILKPENLTPENIRSGIEVAGVTGEMEEAAGLENVPIELNFTDGNQIITAPDGALVKSAIIQKPENLIPANIAEGVDIAGIVGTLVAGGGGGNPKITMKTFTGNGGTVYVEHGLGVAPDIVLVWSQTDIQNYLLAGYALGEKLRALLSGDYVYMDGRCFGSSSNGCIAKRGTITDIDDVGVNVGNSNLPTYNRLIYNFVAIGGLT